MNVKQAMLKRETLYSKYATFDKEHIRLYPFVSDNRPHFFRDIDRIIHSSSYARYVGKTQVFSLPKNDMITKRMLHVQLVSKIARTIGRALSLNEDLIEAASLGHDLGHVPFSHDGERILNEISLKNNEGYFNHNVQSVRNLMTLEKNGKGLNITIQVLDAILCHNGEIELQEYRPIKKDANKFLEEYSKCYAEKDYCTKLRPMTLEGCVVRISDIIAYLGRDIEDAEKIGLIKKEDIPKEITEVLGNDNSSIINTIIEDIIENSMDKPYIRLSDKVFNGIKDLKAFNYKYIYSRSHTKDDVEQMKFMFNSLFNHILESIENNDFEANVFKDFLSNMSEDYLNNNTKQRIAIDYISGMTDEYFLNEYKNYQKLI